MSNKGEQSLDYSGIGGTFDRAYPLKAQRRRVFGQTLRRYDEAQP